jgi:hypothetical protein
LSSIQKELISGFTRSAEGEKDPRNLAVLFQVATFIAQNFDISGTEEVYLYSALLNSYLFNLLTNALLL